MTKKKGLLVMLQFPVRIPGFRSARLRKTHAMYLIPILITFQDLCVTASTAGCTEFDLPMSRERFWRDAKG